MMALARPLRALPPSITLVVQLPSYVHSVQVSNGQVTFKIRNAGGSALNGTLIIMFACL